LNNRLIIKLVLSGITAVAVFFLLTFVMKKYDNITGMETEETTENDNDFMTFDEINEEKNKVGDNGGSEVKEKKTIKT